MSISGVRTACTGREIDAVAREIGRVPDRRRVRPTAAPEPEAGIRLVRSGKMPTTGAAADLLVQPFVRVVRP